jgi:hypothetical protein
MIVEKWAASIYEGEVRLAKGEFRDEDGVYQRAYTDAYRADWMLMDMACLYSKTFRKCDNPQRLFDTSAEALHCLCARELESARLIGEEFREAIERHQSRMNIIDGYFRNNERLELL